jgi:hypothetical protein
MNICKIRTFEGEFINKSLEELRKDIKKVLAIKNKDVFALYPNLAEECMDRHCIYSVPGKANEVKSVCRTFFPIKVEDESDKTKHPNLLFPLDTNKENSNFNQDESHLLLSKPHGKDIKINPEQLKIVVFGLFNIARDANDTITNYYKDINDIKRKFYNIKETFKYVKKEERDKLIYELRDELREQAVKVQQQQQLQPQTSTEPQPQLQPQTSKEPQPQPQPQVKLDETQGYIKNFDDYIKVNEYIEETNNNNSVTALGTLEFMNEILSFLMTDWTCEVDITAKNTYGKSIYEDMCLKYAKYTSNFTHTGGAYYHKQHHKTRRSNRRLEKGKTTVKKLR